MALAMNIYDPEGDCSAEPMDRAEQIDWLKNEHPEQLKRKLLAALVEYPTSDDISSLMLDILNMEDIP